MGKRFSHWFDLIFSILNFRVVIAVYCHLINSEEKVKGKIFTLERSGTMRGRPLWKLLELFKISKSNKNIELFDLYYRTLNFDFFAFREKGWNIKLLALSWLVTDFFGGIWGQNISWIFENKECFNCNSEVTILNLVKNTQILSRKWKLIPVYFIIFYNFLIFFSDKFAQPKSLRLLRLSMMSSWRCRDAATG